MMYSIEGVSLICAAALAVAAAAPAPAATVMQSFQISATGFETGAPVETANGLFRFAYDNGRIQFVPSATGLIIEGLNLSLSGTPAFTYQPNGDVLTVGTSVSFNSFTVSPAVAGFGFLLRNPNGQPFISSFVYSTGSGQLWRAPRIAVAAVPEPGTWALMIAGFGLAGAAARRRRQLKPVSA